MRRIVASVSVALLLACQGSGENQDGVKQFRAWCWSESRPLGDWTTDRPVAQAELDKHIRQIPHHRANIKIWTGPLQTPPGD